VPIPIEELPWGAWKKGGLSDRKKGWTQSSHRQSSLSHKRRREYIFRDERSGGHTGRKEEEFRNSKKWVETEEGSAGLLSRRRSSQRPTGNEPVRRTERGKGNETLNGAAKKKAKSPEWQGIRIWRRASKVAKERKSVGTNQSVMGFAFADSGAGKKNASLASGTTICASGGHRLRRGTKSRRFLQEENRTWEQELLRKRCRDNGGGSRRRIGAKKTVRNSSGLPWGCRY